MLNWQFPFVGLFMLGSLIQISHLYDHSPVEQVPNNGIPPGTSQPMVVDCNCSITQDGATYPVSALLGNVPAPAFYSYGTPLVSSANTGLEVADALVIFLYEDINTGIVSLFLIADIGNSGTGGSMQFEANCLPSTAYVSVQDDAGEFFGAPPLITGNWTWSGCCTDGGVIEDIGCSNTANLDLLVSSGLNSIIWLTGDIANPTTINLGMTGEAITINCGGGVCCPVGLDTGSDIVDATCPDTPNGSITVHPQDGLPPYSYEWSTGDTDATISGLIPGIYAVTVTDAQGCTEELQLTVDVSPGDPSAIPADISLCSENTEELFDLTSLNETINLGTGFDVLWFENADMTGPISDPASYLSPTSTIYAVVDNGSCLSDPVPVTLTVIPVPVGMATTVNLCEESNEMATFDLTSIEPLVSGGTGIVQWFLDPGLNTEVPDPSAFVTVSTTVYATIDDGTCTSLPVAIELVVDLKPLGNPSSMELCGDANDEAIFDLTLLEATISGGNGNVLWYLDMQLLDVIPVPSAFTSTTTTVYAVVDDGVCQSDPVPIDLIVNPTPIGIAIAIDECDDGSGMAIFNLWDYASQVSGSAGAVEWFLDEFLTEPVPDPIAFETPSTIVFAVVDNGLCISDPVQVMLNVLQSPVGNPTTMETCGDGSGVGIFNLTTIEIEVSEGIGTVQWFEDALGFVMISTPTVFPTTGTIVYAQITSGNCLSGFIPVTLVVINSITANPAQLGACDTGNGEAVFDLTDIEPVVSGGTGQVNWYLDMSGMLPIVDTDSFPSGNTTVFANVVAGTCLSSIVPIDLLVLQVPQAMDLVVDICGDTNQVTVIDLTTLDTMIGNSVDTILWYADSLLTIPLGTPTAFISGDTIIYATVSNGLCQSAFAAIQVNVAEALVADSLSLYFCVPPGDTLLLSLMQFDSAVGGPSVQVDWYLDALGTVEITDTDSFMTDTSMVVYASSTNGVCISPLVPVELVVQPQPVAQPFSINTCGDVNGMVTVDLTAVESAVSANSGTVFWYSDVTWMNSLANPATLVTGDTVVYAVVMNGTCISQVAPVTITVVDSLVANAVTIGICAIDTATAIIDLTQFELSISNGGGPVFWFADSLQTDTIADPTSFSTTGDTLFAIVIADDCISNLAMIPVVVEEAFTPLPSCDFTSIDSIAVSWSALTQDYELTYSINGQLIGSPVVTSSNSFNLGGLGQGDTLELSVSALYNGICTMPLTATITCITDVCPAQSLEFVGLEPEYCRDEAFVLIQANPPGGQVSGMGISGDTLYPAAVIGNTTTISYLWEETISGCQYDLSAVVMITDPPNDPVVDCGPLSLSEVSFEWSGSGDQYGYIYQINQGGYSQPVFTSDTGLLIQNLMEGDEVTLGLWVVGQGACGNSDTILVSCITKVCPPATIKLVGDDQFCADDEPVQLGVSTLGLMSIDRITWSGPGITDPTGVFDPSLAMPGIHTLVVTVESDGCIYPVSINIGVLPVPVPSFDVLGVPCQDSVLDVVFTGIGTLSSTWYWELNGAVVTSDNRPFDFSVQWDTPGDYVLSLYIDYFGCISDTFALPVQIDAPLDTPIITCVEENYYSLMLEWEPVAGATQYMVTSSLGTGTLSGTTYSITNLPDDTTVAVQVVALGDSECGPSSATVECHTLDFIPPEIYIANVFSPNGDGINDVFFIQSNDRVSHVNTFRIFDRWGNVVFESAEFLPNDPQYGWDGVFNNKVMNPAVFTYLAELEDIDGHPILRTGEITLIR